MVVAPVKTVRCHGEKKNTIIISISVAVQTADLNEKLSQRFPILPTSPPRLPVTTFSNHAYSAIADYSSATILVPDSEFALFFIIFLRVVTPVLLTTLSWLVAGRA